MNKRIIIRARYSKLLSLFLLVGLTACSGGGTESTSSGSGDNIKVASGTIIGFGSVIVNGIEFSRKPGLADDRVKLSFENNTSAGENNLRIGMTVNIKGTINSATGTGEYESIDFQPELRGPLDVGGIDTIASTLTVMGRKVQVTANTSFDNGLADISDLQAGNHPELEISGNLDNSSGTLIATRIARKALNFNTQSDVQIKGQIATANVVSGASGGSFTIGTVSVNFTSAALGSNTTITDIAAGSVVEVKGVLNGTVITASRIEKKKAVDAEVNDSVKLKGTANGGVVNNTFTISGPNGAITINTTTASFQKGGTTATAAIVMAGTSLEVEGILRTDGSVAATKVCLEAEKTVKLEGNALAGAFNAGTQTLTLNGVPVIISTSTRLLDKSGLTLDPANIAPGDHLQIRGIINSSSKVTASQVQLTSGSKVIIQGPVTAAASPNLTLIGLITVDTFNVIQATGFGDDRSVPAVVPAVKFSGRDAFFAALTSDGFTVVKAKGTMDGTTMIASEVELEQAP
jgi:hypothetical protein